MKIKFTLFFIATFFYSLGFTQVNSLAEGFDAITDVSGSAAATPVTGWTAKNNSSPVGSSGWFSVVGAGATPYSGADAIGASFNNVTGANTISNWLISPQLNLQNGAVIKFWTMTFASTPEYPDNLQVRLSTAGASVDVGTANNSVGVFTTQLLEINPTFSTNTYPQAWTEYTITLSGIAGTVAGRIAFRYYVEDGGPSGNNSDNIFIDQFTYAQATPVTLLNFSAVGISDSKVNLQWTTGCEINNAFFSIERSLDGKAFSEIGKVASLGNVCATQEYLYSDETIATLKSVTTVYYRLKQVDIDGKFSYSNIILLKLRNKGKLDIVNTYFSSNNLNVKFNAETQEKTTVSISDITGKLINTNTIFSQIGINNFIYDMGRLGSGIYLVTINNNTDKVSTKIYK
jgi:predicted CopG family antitoxin